MTQIIPGLDEAALKEAAARVDDRFFTYRQNREKQPETEERIDMIHSLVMDLAMEIEVHVPNGRNKAIALTALEDVQIRAIRAMFEHTKPAN